MKRIALGSIYSKRLVKETKQGKSTPTFSCALLYLGYIKNISFEIKSCGYEIYVALFLLPLVNKLYEIIATIQVSCNQ